jgi:hypothetical protein
LVAREGGLKRATSLHPSFLACSCLAGEPEQERADRDRRNLDNLNFQVQDFIK